MLTWKILERDAGESTGPNMKGIKLTFNVFLFSQWKIHHLGNL
jgi:hypothetical protein